MAARTDEPTNIMYIDIYNILYMYIILQCKPCCCKISANKKTPNSHTFQDWKKILKLQKPLQTSSKFPSFSADQRVQFEPRKKPSYFPLNPGWLIGILISWFIGVFAVLYSTLCSLCLRLSISYALTVVCDYMRAFIHIMYCIDQSSV